MRNYNKIVSKKLAFSISSYYLKLIKFLLYANFK